MIIKFQSMDVKTPSTLGTMTLECSKYRFQDFPYKTHEERTEIWNKWSDAHVIYVEPHETCLEREFPEFGVFRIYDKSYEHGSLDYICENTRVYVMNNEGKTIDTFRIA